MGGGISAGCPHAEPAGRLLGGGGAIGTGPKAPGTIPGFSGERGRSVEEPATGCPVLAFPFGVGAPDDMIAQQAGKVRTPDKT